jgi:hypothetical protein
MGHPGAPGFNLKELYTMTRFNMKMLAGAAAALTLVTMTAVTAAPDAAGDCAGPGRMGHHDRTDRMDRMGMMHGGEPGAMAEQRLAQLKTELKISATQEPAWSAFAAKAAEQATAMQARHLLQREARQANEAKPSAPERMAERVDQMKLNLTSMEAMSSATRDLYAALSPEQRAIADQQLGRQGHPGRHGNGHGPRS